MLIDAATAGARGQPPWWQRGVIYQVYPRSFADANGDGVGDLAGIRSRLDYLAWLGVDAVWLCPIYPSPMADFGYDVADHTGVDPLFGTLDELDRLIADVHSRGLRVLLDFVPNHTSDQHPWFIDARSSRFAAHRDWYIWREPAPGGGPPNGWQSAFGSSAWSLDEPTGQYWFHSFLPQQPDLDWTNPRVRAAMAEVLRFWLRRGVDGFRIDVVNLLAKDRELRPGSSGGRQAWGNERAIHPLLRELRAVADEFADRVLIGEIWLPPRRLVRYYGPDLPELQLPFNFQLLELPWQAARVHAAIVRYERLLPPEAWPNWVLGNHDRSRIASRVGAAQARVAALLLLTLRGTPTLYYGDELGMADVPVPSDEARDPQGRRGGFNRDAVRAPMRWNAGTGTGFSAGEPWLPIGPAQSEINVEAERDDPASVLALYRRLLDLRRREPALNVGEWHDLGRAGSMLAYVRHHGQRRFLVALNLAGMPGALPMAARSLRGHVVVATDAGADGTDFDGRDGLAADAAVVVLLD